MISTSHAQHFMGLEMSTHTCTPAPSDRTQPVHSLRGTGDVHTHIHSIIELNLCIHFMGLEMSTHTFTPAPSNRTQPVHSLHGTGDVHTHQLPLIELNLCIHFVGLEMSTHTCRRYPHRGIGDRQAREATSYLSESVKITDLHLAFHIPLPPMASPLQNCCHIHTYINYTGHC